MKQPTKPSASSPSSGSRSSSRSSTSSSSTSRSRTCARDFSGSSLVRALVGADRLRDRASPPCSCRRGGSATSTAAASCSSAGSRCSRSARRCARWRRRVETLVAARVLQGIGAAALTPNSLGLVLPLFPPERRSTRDRRVGGDRRGRRLDRAAARRPARRGQLAADLHRQRAARADRDRARAAARARGPRRAGDAAARPPRASRCSIAAVGLLTLGLTQGQHWGWDERVLGAFAAAGGARRGLPAPLRPPSRAGRRAGAAARARLRARRALDAAVLRRLRRACCSATSSSSPRSGTTRC